MTRSLKILITGGTGLIGRRLADYLLEHGHRPVIVSRKAVRPFELPADIGFVQWDGKTARNWAAELDGADAVVNL
ncbi:MAG: NAD-dependent epimerase/dehydratase family protein, partial [Chloroflexi bacterium]